VGQATIAGQTYTVMQGSPDDGDMPPPPPFSTVEINGKVQSTSGRCPSIRFELGGTAIVTNSDTGFRNLKCTDVKKDVRLDVQGIAQPDGSVLATQVSKTD
jgi:Domain of unknown function (DUF5666)